MTIPSLSTSDKSFICSYDIGSNIDFRLASGVMNEITTYTTEYIEGCCWIPVFAPTETNDQSNFWDVSNKDIVYIKAGCRVSSDGYIHTWLTDAQKVSELILWNNRYNTTDQPIDDTTTLHWAIEKLYRQVIGNVATFVPGNIKFQNYVGGAIRLYLFGTYSNSILNGVSYSINHPTDVLESSVTWYPNNSTSIYGDYLYSPLDGASNDCNPNTVGSDHLMNDTFDAFILTGVGLATEDVTDEANSNSATSCPLCLETTSFGGSIYIGNSCQFKGVEFDIIQTLSGSPVGSWHYWREDHWAPLVGIIDETNGFKWSGVRTLTYKDPQKWTTTTVEGESMYFIRGSIGGEVRRQPLMRVGHMCRPDGWINFFSNFSKGTPPKFYKRTLQGGVIDVMPICHPYEPIPPTMYRQWIDCHIRDDIPAYTAKGNNSGYWYMVEEHELCTACDDIPCPCVAEKLLIMSVENNRKYIIVPAHCEGGVGGDSQAVCEAGGGTWVPKDYACDPDYVYDTWVNYQVYRWIPESASAIDYSEGRARFDCAKMDDRFLCVAWEHNVLDKFSEYVDGDLDELRHINFNVIDTGVVTNTIKSIFTKHVGVGLITFATAPTFYTTDWIITWGTDEYFDSWSSPDGLGARDPGSTRTLLDRPVTHHDEFYTGLTDIEGGFLYDLVTSNAFLSRDPGTEIKIVTPVTFNCEFDWLHTLVTSNAFLLRDPGTETKIVIPLSYNSDFSWLYRLTTSHGFMERVIAVETKIEIPISYNYDFSWLYKLIKPKIAILYHLKTDGDDTKDGLSWDNAWQHWTYMAQNMPGDWAYTVLVEEGVYDDNETQIGPDNTTVVYLVKDEEDAASTVEVKLT